MAGRRALHATLAALAVAAGVTLYFLVTLKPSSAGAYAFGAVWLNLPYLALAAVLLALRRRGALILPLCIVALLVTAAGLYVHVDAIYLHRDAQGAIAVMITPVLQGVLFLVLAPLAWWAGRRTLA